MGMFTKGAPSAPVEKKQHDPYPWLVFHDLRHRWVQCPICLSVDDGHLPDGRPMYSGGVIEFVTDGNYAMVCACTCKAGEAKRDGVGLRSWLDMPKGTQWITRPASIAWKRGSSQPRPTTIDDEDSPALIDLQQILATASENQEPGHVDEYLAEISTNVERMRNAHNVDDGPTLDEIRSSDVLLAYYCDRDELRATQAIEAASEVEDEQIPSRGSRDDVFAQGGFVDIGLGSDAGGDR